MSHVRSNITIPTTPFTLSEDDVKSMTTERFWQLPLSDMVAIYNNYPSEYFRLTSEGEDSAPKAEDTDVRTPEQRFCDEFERIVDDAIRRAFHPQNGSNS